MNLRNKVAIVTGASRGIGKSIALELAQEGCHLALVARSESDLRQTAQACSEQVQREIFPFDLTAINKIPQLLEKIHARFPQIHILVNDAGKYATGNPWEADLSEWDQTLDLNFRAVYHLTNGSLTFLQENQQSAIINICSIAGLMTSAGGEIYNSSKHALKGYAGCLFESVRERGIKVTNIYPGFVNTGMVAGGPLDHDKMIQPQDIASAVSWALKTPDNACPTDITIRPQRTPYR